MQTLVWINYQHFVGRGFWCAPPEDTDKHTIPDPDPADKNIWLFDLSKDPLETTDVHKKHPHVTVKLLNKLYEYQQSAVPARFPDNDPQCDPDNHGGFWSPWA